MMRYMEEPLTPELMADVDAIMQDLYDNTPAKENRPPFEFDWMVYVTIQDKMVITTARDDAGALIAFAFYIVMPHVHHASTLVAECDSIIVRPDQRGRGIGKVLYSFTENLLRAMNVRYITQRYRVVYGVEPMFPKLGFTLEEHVYIKRMY